jgi:hypothetical protein
MAMSRTESSSILNENSGKKWKLDRKTNFDTRAGKFCHNVSAIAIGRMWKRNLPMIKTFFLLTHAS